MPKKFCKRCGVHNRKVAQFCDSCGVPLAPQARTISAVGTHSELPLPEFIRTLLGTRIPAILPRFKSPGWRYQGKADIGCGFFRSFRLFPVLSAHIGPRRCTVLRHNEAAPQEDFFLQGLWARIHRPPQLSRRRLNNSSRSLRPPGRHWDAVCFRAHQLRAIDDGLCRGPGPRFLSGAAQCALREFPANHRTTSQRCSRVPKAGR